MSGMFSECYSLTILNISNFTTNNKKININNIFDNVNKNCKIICNDEKIKQIQHKKFE
jgi:surface protein